MANFKRAGTSATFWVVALFFGVLVIIGILAWLRRTHHQQPTNPASPTVSYRQHIPPTAAAALGVK